MEPGRVRLRMEDVHYRRGDARVIRGVCWTVRAGEHWAVLGPNGSGKTTLALVATGYAPSSRGRTYLLDGWLSEIALPEARRRVGLVSAALTDQMTAYHRHTTGLQVVVSGRYASLGLYERPAPEETEEARRILEALGGGHLADLPFGIMSTGQRQACLVARAQMARSDLVILDEPCAGLDLVAREALLGGLEAACRARPQVPLVLMTHHTQEVLPAVTHVLLLRHGRAVAQGPRQEVLTEGHLGETFGLPVQVLNRRDRIWVIPRGRL